MNYCRGIHHFADQVHVLKDLAGNAFNGSVIFISLIMLGVLSPINSDVYNKWRELTDKC